MIKRMALVMAVVAVAGISCLAAEVKVYEGTRTILTGPFKPKGPAPQERLDDFKPVEHPAVYVENEYLRCCVLPTIGGRLYEVYSKASASQVFFVNPYLEMYPDDHIGGPWNLGGVEVNFPYFHHGNTYNDRWQWAKVRRDDGSAGVVMGFTSRPTMQRALFRVVLRPGVARVDLEYRFENLNPYPWGLAAWIDTMHPKTMQTEFILPVSWVAGHGHNSSRTHLDPWPVRNGVDLSWQKNVPEGTSLSEFGYMPRLPFHGCYDHGSDRGAVRVFDPETLPAMKLWTQAPPVTPEQYYQHFEIWTATSAVMEDPRRQAELSSCAAADSWYQVWGIGGYVFANEDLALNLVRREDGSLLAGVCGTRVMANCVVSLREGHETFYRATFDLDPAKPWKQEIAAPKGDVTVEVIGPDGTVIASYERREDEVPQELWKMPETPRWRRGINAAYYDEDYSTLWRWRGHFFDGAINRYRSSLKENPESTRLMVDLARAYLKDAQVRLGSWYRDPGPEADADAAKRREAAPAEAVKLLQEALKRDPRNGRAHLYLGLALERQGNTAEAVAAYRAAVRCNAAAAGVYLARRVLKDEQSEALALARQAALVYPQSTLAKHTLVVALAAHGRAAEAALVAAKLHQDDPSDPVTTRLLGEALRATGKEADARAFDQETDRLLAGDDKARKDFEADLQWLKGE